MLFVQTNSNGCWGWAGFKAHIMHTCGAAALEAPIKPLPVVDRVSCNTALEASREGLAGFRGIRVAAQAAPL